MTTGAVTKLAIFDLDGTLLACDSLVELTRFMLARRWRSWRHAPRMVAGTLRLQLGLQTAERLKETFLAVIDDLDAEGQEGLVRDFVDYLMARKLREPIAGLVRQYIGSGHHTVLISASPDLYVEPLAGRLGFASVLCTRLADRPTGGKASAIVGGNCKGERKLTVLLDALSGTTIDWQASFACSDHISDLPLLERVGSPLAVHPDRRLRAHARARGWAIEASR